MVFKTSETVFQKKYVDLSGSAAHTADGSSSRSGNAAGSLGLSADSPGSSAFPVLCFAAWEKLAGVRHCFTTRAGGVSEGYLASLNFRRDLYDPAENILENYRRAALFFDTVPDRIVCAQQTHTANVRIVTQADAGKGVTRERDYSDVDGIITDVPGLVLFTSHADCVPLYFYDPVRRVIALSHSGWKGTVLRIGAVTIRKMQDCFGCDPADIYAAIGPSICVDCYEVSDDVAEKFRTCFSAPVREHTAGKDRARLSDAEDTAGKDRARLSDAEDTAGKDRARLSDAKDTAGKDRTCLSVPASDTVPRILHRGRKPGKYQLDLWQANVRILREAGIMPEHIAVTNLCTCENADELFSHRATGGRRGLSGAFLMLDQ